MIGRFWSTGHVAMLSLFTSSHTPTTPTDTVCTYSVSTFNKVAFIFLCHYEQASKRIETVKRVLKSALLAGWYHQYSNRWYTKPSDFISRVNISTTPFQLGLAWSGSWCVDSLQARSASTGPTEMYETSQRTNWLIVGAAGRAVNNGGMLSMVWWAWANLTYRRVGKV